MDTPTEDIPRAFTSLRNLEAKKLTCPSHLIKEDLPKMVKDLSNGSNRWAVDESLLFFKKDAGDWRPPDEISFRGLPVSYSIYYIWQGDGSLAVYAYLYLDAPGSVVRPPPAVGCMFLGFIAPNMWKG